MEINYADIIVIFILLVTLILSIIIIKRNKGKCAYCRHNDNCPFKKVNEDVK